MARTQQLYDAEGGVIRTVVLNDAADPHSIVGFHATQNCDAILAHVTRLRDEAGSSARKHGRHLAEIPVTIVDEWFRTGAIHDPEFIKRWLRDSSNAAFRVDTGSI